MIEKYENHNNFSLNVSNNALLSKIDEAKKSIQNMEMTFQGTEHNDSSIYNINEQGAQNRRDYFHNSAYQQMEYKKQDILLSDDIQSDFKYEPPSITPKNISSIQNNLDPSNLKDKQASLQRTSEYVSSQNCNLATPSQITTIEERRTTILEKRQHQINENKEIQNKFFMMFQNRATNYMASRVLSESSCQLQDSPMQQGKAMTSQIKKSIYQEKFDSQFAMNLSENLLVRYDQNNQKKNYMVIITYMKKFANKLLLKLAYKDYSLLNANHINIINDRSIIDYHTFQNENSKCSSQVFPLKYDNQILQNKKYQLFLRNKGQFSDQKNSFSIFQVFFSVILKGLKEINNRIGVITPNSIIIATLQTIIVGLIFYFIFVLSIQACFLNQGDYELPVVKLVHLSGITYSLIDIYIGFYQGFYEFGCVVNDRIQIAQRYFKTTFSIDLIILIIYFFNYFYPSDLILLLIVIFSVMQINDYFKISSRFPFWFEILKLLITLLLIAHMCGCGFHYVGLHAQHGNYDQKFNRDINNWIDFQGLNDSSWQTRYINSLYFSVITMVTVGYGDIYPVNVLEKCYAIGMAFVSCGVFAYSVNSIGQIFSEIKLKTQSFQQKQFDLLNFMRIKNISKETQIRILKYLEYLEDQSDQIITKGQDLLQEYPTELRDEVMKENFLKLLNQVPVLKNIFSQDFLTQLCIKFKEKRIGPGEILVKKNQQLENLYIITKGVAEYVNFEGSEKLSLFQIKNVQNEQSIIDVRLFFTGLQADVSVQSKTVCQVAYISFQDFYTVAKQYPNDYVKLYLNQTYAIQQLIIFQQKEIFCMMKDQFLNDQRQYIQCQSCNQNGHSFINCQQLHYNVDSQIFVKRLFKSINQERRQTIRLRRKKYNPLFYRNLTQSNLKILRWTYAQQYLSNYNFINPYNEVTVEENGKEFYMRCPKINQNHFMNNNDNLFQSQKLGKGTFQCSSDSMESDSTSKFSQSSILSPSNQSQTLVSEQKLKDPMSENSIQTFENKRVYRTQTQQRKTVEPENPNVIIKEIPLFNSRDISFSQKNENQLENIIIRQESEYYQRSSKNDSLQKLDTLDRLAENLIPEQQRLQIFPKPSHKKSSAGSDGRQNEENNTQTTYSFGGSSLKNKQKNEQQEKLHGETENRMLEKLTSDLRSTIYNQIHHQLIANPIYQLLENIVDNPSKNKSGQQSMGRSSTQLLPQETIDITKDNIQTDLKTISGKKKQNSEGRTLVIPNYKKIPSLTLHLKQDIDQSIPFQTQENEEKHIFGKLKFEFDRVQEFEKYYPRNNQSKVIKSYKKWQVMDNLLIIKSPKKIGKLSGKSRLIEIMKGANNNSHHGSPAIKNFQNRSSNFLQEFQLN